MSFLIQRVCLFHFSFMDSFIHPFIHSTYRTLPRTWTHWKDRGGLVGGMGLAMADLVSQADTFGLPLKAGRVTSWQRHVLGGLS